MFIEKVFNALSEDVRGVQHKSVTDATNQIYVCLDALKQRFGKEVFLEVEEHITDLMCAYETQGGLMGFKMAIRLLMEATNG